MQYMYLFLVSRNRLSITCTGTSVCCESLRGYDGRDEVTGRDGLPGPPGAPGQDGQNRAWHRRATRPMEPS